MTQCSRTSHDRCIGARIGTALAGLLSCTDTGCRCHQSDCKNQSSDCANVHVTLLASLILTGLLECGAFHREPPKADTARCGKTPHPALCTRSSSFTAKGRSTHAGAGAAVVDGNLERPGAGLPQPVGGDRWFCSTRVAAPESGAGSGKARVIVVLLALSSRLQPGEHHPSYSYM